jgi:hypothetical protein
MEGVLFKGAPRESELIPFVVMMPMGSLPPWFRLREIESVIEDAAVKAVDRLWCRQGVRPGQLLARKNVPAELRSQAARSMLAMRGGRATAAKMRAVGFPNLVKAREALRRKAALATTQGQDGAELEKQ